MSRGCPVPFDFAAGSVTGRAHLAAGRGSQDAVASRFGSRSLVAVVADGCGSGEHSEVGAALGARLVVEALGRRVDEGEKLDDAALWPALRDEVLGALSPLLSPLGGTRAEVVSELFLFTLVGFAITEGEGAVFACGDGVYAIDGEATVLGPFARNEPPYLGYGLLGPSDRSQLEVVRRFDPARIDWVLAGTDGAADLHGLAGRSLPGSDELVGPLSSFAADRFFTNKDALRRRLALVNREVTRPDWPARRLGREPGLLHDDTTLAIARRRA